MVDLFHRIRTRPTLGEVGGVKGVCNLAVGPRTKVLRPRDCLVGLQGSAGQRVYVNVDEFEMWVVD